MFDTIVAISTPLQDGAISIVRLSGDRAIEIANKMFSKDLTNAKGNTIHYGFIRYEDKDVDEVLVSVFRAPNSYTTEDVVEINCHGGMFVTRKILQIAMAFGAKMANPGEFTKRAYLNGRIDLTQAEGVNDIINARNNTNMNNALSSMKGSVKELIQPLCDDLMEIIAQIEVNIDYPEYEDIAQIATDELLPLANNWLVKIDDIITKAENSYMMKSGINTVILGKPNVGKSSLLNALLEEDKAIVTDVAGTTRDLVEGVIQCGNITLNLIDTAGIHQTEDKVEKIGIDKSMEALSKAQLVIVVLDSSKEIDEEDKKLLDITKDYTRIVVYNKKDISTNSDGISISALNKDVDPLIKEIEKIFSKEIFDYTSSTLNNERQIGLAKQAKEQMKNAIAAINNNVETDLVTIDIQGAYNSLKEILGEVNKDDLLDTLFSKFCLGK